MEFCEKCGTMLEARRKDGKTILFCSKCETEKNLSKEKQTLKKKIKHSDKEKTIIIENPDELKTMPTKKMHCPKCGKTVEAQYWTVQTRSGDEAPTRFYRCTKCKHTWREYD
ncbi:MAG: transcription factor S [Candidatus Heimdallarchaeota archaeon]|nr:transcription factor S [Candidatus Heimdallarchaeota archaeon]